MAYNNSGQSPTRSEYDSGTESDIEDDFKSQNARRPCPVILHLDLDCYEVQLLMHQKYPDLIARNIPCVAVNHDGMVLAVNYAAKRLGIQRKTATGENAARDICKKYKVNLTELKTDTRFGKSDSFRPLTESYRILDVIDDYNENEGEGSIRIDRASKDEFYLDVTKLVDRRIGNNGGTLNPTNFRFEIDQLTRAKKGKTDETYARTNMVVMEGKNSKIKGDSLNYRILEVYGAPPGSLHYRAHHQAEYRLVHGALIAMEISKLIYKNLGYIVSSGVAHSKLLAKIACGRHKPEGITIITEIGFERLSRSALNITDLPGFGGPEGQKLAAALLTTCDVEPLFEVLKIKRSALVDLCQEVVPKLGDGESVANDLRKKCRGMDDGHVEENRFTETVTASSSFKGYRKCSRRLVQLLCADMADRLKYFSETHHRRSDLVSVKVKTFQWKPQYKRPSNVLNQMNIENLDPDMEEAMIRALNFFVLNYIKNLGIADEDIVQIENIQLTASQMRDH